MVVATGNGVLMGASGCGFTEAQPPSISTVIGKANFKALGQRRLEALSPLEYITYLDSELTRNRTLSVSGMNVFVYDSNLAKRV